MKYSNQLYKRTSQINCLKILFPLGIFLVVIMTSGCNKFVQVPAPTTSINADNVYSSDPVAASVLTGIYTKLANGGATTPQLLSISIFLGLSADEFSLSNTTSNTSFINYYQNASDNNTSAISSDFWTNSYQVIFVTNAAIAGLTNNTNLTPAVDQQLLGEAKFMRAFCYFYLVNLYGDVPLVTTTSYAANSVLLRTPKAQVYQQIISDLKDAESLLSDHYIDGTILAASTERVRPTKWAASALLARTYLYTNDWANAAKEASLVIGNTGTYSLSALGSVFLKNSSEAIWQLQPVQSGKNTVDAPLLIVPATGLSSSNPISLGSSLLSSFAPGDKRLSNWVSSVTYNVGTTPTTTYFAYKYKVSTFGAAVTEYQMVLRLGEQYLIRAEAEAQQGDLTDAATDLNMIRTRAGLPNTTSTTQPTLLTAIQNERRVELFSEWGHRWLDLKRTGTVDAVMNIATPLKGGTWDTRHQLYPISNYELINDQNLVQNPGY
jgi:hypothetical protein